MSQDELKIAVPSFAPGGLEALVNTRFGRCEFMTIVTVENGQIKEVNVVQNQGMAAMGGAGPMAAQLIAKEGAKVVIGANYGPNAANALNQGGIKTFGYPMDKGELTVKQMVELYLSAQIQEISGSNVPSHTGMGGGGMGGGGMGRGGGRGMGGSGGGGYGQGGRG
jgi:predicted Fe-Mo cluster-binding NifX family protein